MEDIQQLKELWKVLFNDSDEFISFFFQNVYEESNSCIIKENERILSALYMLPYHFLVWGKEIPVSYISGAGTLPEVQGKGLMKKLLLDTFRKMQQRNIPLSILIPAEPWLYGFYEKSGYATVFHYTEKTYEQARIENKDDSIQIVPVNDQNIEMFCSFYDNKLRERKSTVLHPLANFKAIVHDYALSQGIIRGALQNGDTPTGIVFATKADNKTFLIKDFIYSDNYVKEVLLSACADCFSVRKGIYRIPSTDKTDQIPFGMARIIDAYTLLSLWAERYPEKELRITLTDPLLPANDGYYVVRNGQCTKEDISQKRTYPAMNISALAQMLFLPEFPFMSLMYD